MLRAAGVDHLVLNVSDPERTLAWYRDKLGLEPARYDEWKRGEAPFVSVRLNGTTVIDLMVKDRTGTNVDHFCVVVEEVDLQAVADSGEFEVVGGPWPLWGAQGEGTGLYVKDPDGNVVELRHYGS